MYLDATVRQSEKRQNLFFSTPAENRLFSTKAVLG